MTSSFASLGNPVRGGAATIIAGDGWVARYLTTTAEFLELRPHWQALAGQVQSATCFMWPAMFQAWRQVLAAGVEPGVIAVFEAEQLRAVLPVMQGPVWRGPSLVPRIDYAPGDSDLTGARWRRPLRVRQLASVVSWRAACVRPTLLCNPEHRVRSIGLIAEAMLRRPGWEILVLPVHEGEDSAVWLAAFQTLNAQVEISHLGRAVLTIENVRPFDDVVAQQSRNFRKNIRRARAAAERAGLRLSMIVGRSAVLGKLATLARVAKASWKHTGRSGTQVSVRYEGSQQRFFEAVIADENAGLEPVLSVATVDGEACAMALVFRHGSSATGTLLFRDGRYDEASPGQLVLAHLIDWAAASRLQRLDLNATQEWISHLADQRTAFDNLVVFAPTLAGRGCAWIARANRRRSRVKG